MATADALTPRRRRWLIARGLLRALATAVLMVLGYYTLPFGSLADVPVAAELSVGVALLVGVIVWQVGAIERAKYPAIRATQALAVTTPLFLLLFAAGAIATFQYLKYSLAAILALVGGKMLVADWLKETVGPSFNYWLLGLVALGLPFYWHWSRSGR